MIEIEKLQFVLTTPCLEPYKDKIISQAPQEIFNEIDNKRKRQIEILNIKKFKENDIYSKIAAKLQSKFRIAPPPEKNQNNLYKKHLKTINDCKNHRHFRGSIIKGEKYRKERISVETHHKKRRNSYSCEKIGSVRNLLSGKRKSQSLKVQEHFDERNEKNENILQKYSDRKKNSLHKKYRVQSHNNLKMKFLLKTKQLINDCQLQNEKKEVFSQGIRNFEYFCQKKIHSKFNKRIFFRFGKENLK